MKNIVGKVIHRISRLKILYKLLLVYIVIVIVPLTLLGSYMTCTTGNTIMNQHKNQVEAENKRIRNILFNVIYLATNISDNIIYDSELIKLLNTSYDTEDEVYEAYRSYKAINSILSSNTEFSSIKIYVTNETLVTSGVFVRVDEQIAASDWYQEVKGKSGKLMWIYDNSIDTASSLQLVRSLPVTKSDDYAILSINVSTSYLRFMINSNTINSILSINNMVSFYSHNYNEVGRSLAEIFPVDTLTINKAYKAEYQDKDTLAYSGILNAPKSKSKFQITTLDSLTYSDINKAIIINLELIIANLIISLLIIISFSIVFNRSILILRWEMNKIANGDLNIINSFRRQDELGELFADMKKTLYRIQQLNSSIYEEKLSRQRLLNYQQQMEFSLLANQINPHFLYNTLETIRMQLSVSKEKEAARIVKQLGRFMRHNIEADNSLVLLSAELEYIRIYMDIQHFRFGDRINFVISIDSNEDISDYLILPLLIQPIVENAFIHGLENKKTGGTISINISCDEDYVIISVMDNGLGMSEAVLSDLIINMNNANRKPKSHIGLHNVQQRIKLFYGEKYGLSIDSVEKQHTVVTLHLPHEVNDKLLTRNEER